MNREHTLRIEIEQIREELNKAAVSNLNSVECFRLSLKLDALVEEYYEAGGGLTLGI